MNAASGSCSCDSGEREISNRLLLFFRVIVLESFLRVILDIINVVYG